MTLEDAFEIVYQLAEQNVLEEKFATPDDLDSIELQREALDVMQGFMADIVNRIGED